MVLQSDQATSNGCRKRKLIQVGDGSESKRLKSSSTVIDYSNPFAITKMLQAIDVGKFGTVSSDLREVDALRMEFVKYCISLYPSLADNVFGEDKTQKMDNEQVVEDAINLDDDDSDALKKALCLVPSSEIVILDSDDEDAQNERPMCPFQSSLVQHQKIQRDVPLVPFEEVHLGKGKLSPLLPKPSADKAMAVSPMVEEKKDGQSPFHKKW